MCDIQQDLPADERRRVEAHQVSTKPSPRRKIAVASGIPDTYREESTGPFRPVTFNCDRPTLLD